MPIAAARIRPLRWVAAAGLPLVIGVIGEARQAPAPSSTTPAATSEFFESKIRPVLAGNCYDCHTEEHFGGLRLDSREAMLKGGNSRPARVPGDPDKASLIRGVRQTREKLKRRKGGRLRPEEVEARVEWVRAGARWSTPVATTAAASTSSPAAAPAPAKPAAKAYVITPA